MSIKTVKSKVNGCEMTFSSINGVIAMVEPCVAEGYIPMGLDLSKSRYQVCYFDDNNELINKQRTPEEFDDLLLDFQAKGKKLLVGFEHCSGSNKLARKILNMQFKCKVMNTAIVSGYKKNKDDAIDALALLQKVQSPFVKSEYIRDDDNLEMRRVAQDYEHTTKYLYDKVRKANSSLIEMGYIYKNKCTLNNIGKAVASVINQEEAFNKDVSYFNNLLQTLKSTNDNIKRMQNDNILKKIREDEKCQLAFTIPGMNAISVYYAIAAIGDISRFKSPKALAAYFGLIPGHTGTGGKIEMGRIQDGGDPLFRRAIFNAAVSLLARSKRENGKYSSDFLERVKAKDKHFKQLVIAIAVKMVNVLWAVLTFEEAYDPEKGGLGPCKSVKDPRCIDKGSRLETLLNQFQIDCEITDDEALLEDETGLNFIDYSYKLEKLGIFEF